MAEDFNKKPDDMADDTVISGDGVNPVSRDEERSDPRNGLDDGMDIHFPGVVPPAYFPGYPGMPGGPSIG